MRLMSLTEQPIQYHYRPAYPRHPQDGAPQAVVYRVRLAPIVIIVPPFLVVVIGKVGIRIRVHEGLLGVPSVADIHVMTPEELASAGADQ